MNSREAKFILESWHANEVGGDDPRFEEALRMVECDPELANWFAVSQDFDRSMREKLRSVPVPDELLERIRAGQPEVPVSPAPGSRRRFLAMAASVAVLGSVAGLAVFRRRAWPLTAFREDMAKFLDQVWDHTFDLAEDDYANVKQWLEKHGEPGRLEIPSVLADSRTVGCKELRWKRRSAALICFLPAHTRAVVHILVVDRSALVDPPGPEPQFFKLPTWNSAIWSTGSNVYLALTTADSDKLAGCFS